MESNQPEEISHHPAPENPKNETYPVSPSLYQLRKYFVYVLVGGLIISALIAIIAVLIGNMTGLVGKTIATVAIIIAHSLVALAFISVTSNKQPNKGSAIVINTLFAITVLSLITAMLGVWDIITDGGFIARQYGVFSAAIITSFIIYGLFQSVEDDKSTAIARRTSIGAVLASFVLLLPILYEIGSLPDFYYRLLTAVNIVVGVSIVITVIFHWYYMSRHPKVRPSYAAPRQLTAAEKDKTVLHVVLILVAVFFGIPFVIGMLQAFSRLIN